MNISSVFLTMAQTAEVSQPTLFPFPMGMYIVFCIIATAFLVFRFVKEKAPYQIIMAVAIPLSLLIGFANGKTLFYLVGIVEVVLLIAALVTTIVCKKKTPETVPETTEENTPAEDTAAESEEE